MMEFRTASMEYIERMCEITEDAKRQLRSMGLDQWQKGYPSREVWLKDIQDGCTYLAVDDGNGAHRSVIRDHHPARVDDPASGRLDGALPLMEVLGQAAVMLRAKDHEKAQPP